MRTNTARRQNGARPSKYLRQKWQSRHPQQFVRSVQPKQFAPRRFPDRLWLNVINMAPIVSVGMDAKSQDPLTVHAHKGPLALSATLITKLSADSMPTSQAHYDSIVNASRTTTAGGPVLSVQPIPPISIVHPLHK